MKKIFSISVALLVTASMFTTGCKKGDGDPFLSLHSRKGRFAGEWTVTAGSGTDVNNGISTTFTYDGTTKTTTNPSPFPASTDKFTITYSVKKDGTFTSTYTDNNNSTAVVTTTTGTWNFTGGVGDMKNKSQVVMNTLTESSGNTTYTYTGSDAPSQIIDLYELKNKEIIVKMKGTSAQGSNSSSTDDSWTWTAK